MSELENHFDTDVAETYDTPEGTPERQADLRVMVTALHELAAGGSVLEFAIGTGRVALPLAATGLDVAGIELSQAMLDVMARKPGADRIRVMQGDMSTTRMAGEFSLVVLVYNTIGNLLTQEAQVACFENAARHLAPGGRFVIENMMPPLRRFPAGANGVAFAVGPHHTGVDTLDLATQSMVSHHHMRDPSGAIRYFRTPQRYTWPAELDLMARIAGMELESRWADWDGTEFSGDAEKHVSVWRRP